MGSDLQVVHYLTDGVTGEYGPMDEEKGDVSDVLLD